MKFVATLLFVFLSKILFCQDSSLINQFDSLGYRHGYWEQYVSNKFHVCSPRKAIYKCLLYFDHGYAPSIAYLNNIDHGRGCHVYCKDRNGNVDKLRPGNNSTKLLIDGQVFKLNRFGDTVISFTYTKGIESGTYFIKESGGKYVKGKICFDSPNTLDPLGYEAWLWQDGNCEYALHEKVDKIDGKWGWYAMAEEDYFEHGVRVFLYVKNTSAYNAQSHFTENASLLVNHELYAYLHDERYVEFLHRSDSLIIESIRYYRDPRPKDMAFFQVDNDTICIRVNMKEGIFHSYEKVESPLALVEIARAGLRKRQTYYESGQILFEREKPFTKRKQRRIAKKYKPSRQ